MRPRSCRHHGANRFPVPEGKREVAKKNDWFSLVVSKFTGQLCVLSPRVGGLKDQFVGKMNVAT